VSPLRKSERRAIRQLATQGSSPEVQQVFQQLSRGLGRKSSRNLAGNIAQESPTAGVALYSAADAPKTSRTILDARGALSNVDVELPSADVREVTDEVFGQAFAASPRTRGAYVEAAKNIYAMRANQAGELEWDEDRFANALRLVANGRVGPGGEVQGGPMEINGVQTLPPKAGVSRTQFERVIQSGITEDTVQQFANGNPVYQTAGGELRRIEAEQLRDATFRFIGNGEYAVELNGGAVMAERGGEATQPFVIDLEETLATMSPETE